MAESREERERAGGGAREAWRGVGEAPATSPLEQPADRELDPGLRPRTLADFVGQERVVSNLRLALEAAKARGESPDHVLLSGPPGLGKTSLARILAAELGTHLHATTGPALQLPRDLVGILTQMRPMDVLFVDEIHRVPTAVEEYLYSAMEDFSLEFTVDSGANARVVTLSIARFLLVGATTREGLLSAPFRARFGLLERLEPYPTADLVKILERAARLLGVQLDRDAAELLAARARGTPRVAGRFLRRARDVAAVAGSTRIDRHWAESAMDRLGVDELGLDPMDRRILAYLGRNPDVPVGLKTLAAAVGESEETIEEVFEPHLLRMGLLHRTARGRLVTPAGCEAVGLGPGRARTAGELFP